MPKISFQEKHIIYQYTDDMHEWLNDSIIKNNGDNVTAKGKELYKALYKLPNYEGVVFRGSFLNQTQKMRYQNAFNQKRPIIEHQFFSTSLSRLIAEMYSKNDTVYEIYSFTGKSIEKFSKFGKESGQNEQEILFLPNTAFEVVEFNTLEERTYITMLEIL
jgi:hypothetical protein